MRITDLGIARVWNPDNAKDTSGTPGYMGKKYTMHYRYNQLLHTTMSYNYFYSP